MFEDISSEFRGKGILEGRKPTSKKDFSFAADTQDPEDTDESVHIDSSEARSRGPGLNCPLCTASHWFSQCRDFKRRSVSDWYQFVRENKLCYNCLVLGHYTSACPKASFCKVDGCEDKHSTFLHPQTVRVDNGTQPKVGAQSAYVKVDDSLCALSGGLPVVPVKVRVRAKGSATIVNMYALLDGDSCTSFCSDQLLKDLGAEAISTTLLLTTLEKKNSTRRSALVELGVFNLENNFIELPLVFSTPKLPVALERVPR